MPAFTIVSVEREKPWTGDFGPMIDYTVTLKDDQGLEHVGVVVAQKEKTDKPKVGQTLNGEITPGKFGPKFKKDKPQGGGGFYKPKDPVEIAAIQRQSSQRTAVLYLLAAATAGALTAENFPTVGKIGQWIDFFERDIANNAPAYGGTPKEPKRTGLSDVPQQDQDFIHPPAGDIKDLPIA